MSGATCHQCGAAQPGDSAFCGNCGSLFAASRSPLLVNRPILPTLALTIVITALFGVFGVIPAAVHAGQANQMGQSGARYWKAFGWTLFTTIMVSIALTVLVYGSMLAALFGLSTAVNAPVNTSTYRTAQTYETTYAPATSRETSSSGTNTSVAPTTIPPFPVTTNQCNDWVAVNANTSCEFAQNVAVAYANTGGGAVILRQVYSPITNKYYDMTCTQSDLVICTGGNDAAVYLR